MNIKIINSCEILQPQLSDLSDSLQFELILGDGNTLNSTLATLDKNSHYGILVPAHFFSDTSNDNNLNYHNLSWIIVDEEKNITTNTHIKELVTEQKIFSVLQLPVNDIQLYTTIQQLKRHLSKSSQVEKLYLRFLQQQGHLRKLTNIGIALSNEENLDTLLDDILDIAMEITDSDSGSVYFIEKTKQPDGKIKDQLRFIHAKNNSISVPFQNVLMDLSHLSISGHCALSGNTLNIEDVYQIGPNEVYRFNSGFDLKTGYKSKSMLVTPLKNYRKEIIGVLQLINKKKNPSAILGTHDIIDAEVISFNDFDINILESFGSQAAIAVENKYLIAKIKTQLDEVKKAHEEKTRALITLVSGIAHELNNPVNFITTSLIPLMTYAYQIKDLIEPLIEVQSLSDKEVFDLIKQNSNQKLVALLEKVQTDKHKDDPLVVMTEIGNLLQGIEVGASRIADIVRSLRVFSLLEKPTFTKIDPNKVIEAAVKSARKEFKKFVNIIANLNHLPKIEGNADLLMLGILHILSNAFYAVDDNGTITITSEVKDEIIRIIIEDDGHGIAEDIQSKIFDPFFTTRPIGQGLGLGLSVSFSVIQKHNGKIFYIPTNPTGTRFEIHLPIHS